MRKGYGIIGFLVATYLLAVGGLVALIHETLLDGTGGTALRAGVALMVVFTLLVVVRYLALVWFGYLEHIEAMVSPEPDEFTPPLTIIIPAYNEEAVIQQSVRSLLELDYPAYEILVVDDGSTDATYARAAELEGRYGGVTVRVISKANAGKAAALNTGIALAHHKFVLCMDGDSRLSRDTLRYGMRHFADPRVGAVAGNVKVVNRNNLLTRMQALEYIQGLNLVRRGQGYLRAVSIIPGPIGIFRREALEQVGGYDTDTFAEDADLTFKLLTHGWPIAYEERAIAYTEAPEGLLDLVKQRYRWTRGMLQCLGKRAQWLIAPGKARAGWLSLQLMVFEALVWPLLSVFGNLFVVLFALAAGVPGTIFYWWLLLMMVDTVSALYFVAMEEEELSLIWYVFPTRLFFTPLLDVTRLFAFCEELANVQMTWGKLERVGRI